MSSTWRLNLPSPAFPLLTGHSTPNSLQLNLFRWAEETEEQERARQSSLLQEAGSLLMISSLGQAEFMQLQPLFTVKICRKSVKLSVQLSGCALVGGLNSLHIINACQKPGLLQKVDVVFWQGGKERLSSFSVSRVSCTKKWSLVICSDTQHQHSGPGFLMYNKCLSLAAGSLNWQTAF